MIKITKTKAEIILELSGEYDLKTLKKQYHILGKKHHPDNGGTKEKFEELTEAYTYLEKYIKEKINCIKISHDIETFISKLNKEIEEIESSKIYFNDTELDELCKEYLDFLIKYQKNFTYIILVYKACNTKKTYEEVNKELENFNNFKIEKINYIKTTCIDKINNKINENPFKKELLIWFNKNKNIINLKELLDIIKEYKNIISRINNFSQKEPTKNEEFVKKLTKTL